jgi:hypothetical protein
MARYTLLTDGPSRQIGGSLARPYAKADLAWIAVQQRGVITSSTLWSFRDSCT